MTNNINRIAIEINHKHIKCSFDHMGILTTDPERIREHYLCYVIRLMRYYVQELICY